VAVPPVGPAVRLDQHTLGVARTLCVELARSVAADALSVALARWSSALTIAGDAERAVAFLAALEPLLAPDAAGAADVVALRAAALAGATASERAAVAASIREAALLPANAPVLPAIASRLADEIGSIARAVLIAALGDERRGADLALVLDEVLLGARPRPSLVPAGIAAAPR
jgi:hypothetical protein